MDYADKLKCQRHADSSIAGRDFNLEMESDRGRAVNSAAVRRLQQKTQVFPLETNAAVRSRLTHSLEVQQVGRYIAKLVLQQLNQRGAPGIAGAEEGFVSAVEIACLLHDIGNPPFGHFGEEAICRWGRETLPSIWQGLPATDSQLSESLLQDLLNFEGNAQGLRLLHQLQRLNLSYTQLACLIKYTRCATDARPDKSAPDYQRKKKPGFYYSERALVEAIGATLDIAPGCRFPLTYIMEAADDISYCIADLEDALEKGVLSLDTLHALLQRQWVSLCRDRGHNSEYLPTLLQRAFKAADAEPYQKNHSYILTLRVALVKDLANYAAQRYIEHHAAVFEGRFDEALLDGNSDYNTATETLRLVARRHVFNHSEVEALELKGFQVISGLLKCYTTLLTLSREEFAELVACDELRSDPVVTRLFHTLSDKHKAQYCNEVAALPNDEHFEVLERYHRVRLLLDYISGMTDLYALQQYQSLFAMI
ncbi:MAG: dGTPase [Pseudomonadales bacterium]